MAIIYLGVLTALRSTAQWREEGEVQTSSKPWLAVRDYTMPLSEDRSTTMGPLITPNIWIKHATT